jgi:hypothetical protein
MCDQVFTDKNGILSSFGYKKSCNTKIVSNITNVIKVYILQLSISENQM